MSALPIDGEKEEVKMIFFSQFWVVKFDKKLENQITVWVNETSGMSDFSFQVNYKPWRGKKILLEQYIK